MHRDNNASIGRQLFRKIPTIKGARQTPLGKAVYFDHPQFGLITMINPGRIRNGQPIEANQPRTYRTPADGLSLKRNAIADVALSKSVSMVSVPPGTTVAIPNETVINRSTVERG